MSGEFVEYGGALLAHGYLVLPIKQGSKAPAVTSGWQKLRLTSIDAVAYKNAGLGVLCGLGEFPICAVDIDTSNAELATRFTDWCAENLGYTCARVGNAPKILLPYRAAENGWGKATGDTFFDAEGGRHRLEILGEGQQFVAYHIHPDTQKPYAWVDLLGGISETPANCLPILKRAQIDLALETFSRMAAGAGLTTKRAGVGAGVQQSLGFKGRTGDLLMDYEPPVDGVTLDNALSYLTSYSTDEYDDWREVGMLLHHQFCGDEAAMWLWDMWSQTSVKYAGSSDTEHRWESFGRGGRTPVTFRSALKKHKEYVANTEKNARKTTHAEIAKAITDAADTLDLMSTVAKQAGAASKGDPLLLTEFESLIKTRYKALSGGANIPIDRVRMAMRGKTNDLADPVSGELCWAGNCPQWAKGWVYVAETNVFYHVENRTTVKPEGFRGLYDCELPSDGDCVSAQVFVLNTRQVPRVHRSMYAPSAEVVFKHNNVNYVNTYSRHGTVSIPEKLNAEQNYAVGLLRRHIELIVGGAWNREAAIFVNFLRKVVESPGEKIRWAVLLQGQEGDGKSLFFELMSHILGHANVRTTRGATIESSSGTGFNAWAEGHCFGFIEEIKLHGHNRYDVTNALKPLITNDVVEITNKGRDARNVPNTANWMLGTNYKDGVPLEQTDRRYFVMFSKFPLDKIRREEPEYFNALVGAIREHAGAMARWLLSIEYVEEFKPDGHAPATEDKREAIRLTTDDAIDVVRELLEDSDHPAFGNDVVLFDCLLRVLQTTRGGEMATTNQLSRALVQLGYTKLTRVRILGARHRVWVCNSGGDAICIDTAKEIIAGRELIFEGDF